MLFPRPGDGAELPISPVGLAWLPCPAAADYRVDIFEKNGNRIYSLNTGKNPVHVPDRAFPAGILYPKASLDRIRATLSSSRSKSWRACKSAADRALSKGVPEFPKYHLIEDTGTRRLEYGKYFSYFRGYVDGALMDLSLAFLMTEQEKYARAAKKILLEIASWPTDDDDVTSVSARWGDEAGLSFSKCAHIAYDWLYPALDDNQRKKVFDMCSARAWQTYRRLERRNYLTFPGESHNGLSKPS